MAAAQEIRVEQYWLDVDRPIEPRQVRGAPRQRVRGETAGHQMEFRMAVPRPVPVPEVVMAVSVAPQAEPIVPTPASDTDPAPMTTLPFGAWLLEQTNSRGTLGELAKAAKLDRQFPRKGTADEVRARFSAAGADGDAFEALDDAERDYARQL